MIDISPDEHPELHIYARELTQYPELTAEQYADCIADLQAGEGSPRYDAAREKMICAHLGQVLFMATQNAGFAYGLSMEDFVGLGNLALVLRFDRFKPEKGIPFSEYFRKIITRFVYKNVKTHVIWERDDDVEIDSVGIDGAFNREYLAYRLEQAFQVLTSEERCIMRMLFFCTDKPDYKATAKKFGRTERGLRATVDEIRGKLIPLLSDLRHRRKCFYVTPRSVENES